MSRSPILHIGEILAWADAHRARTGKWPKKDSGRIQDAPRVETWGAINAALRMGNRGLLPRKTLAGLLEKHRGVRNIRHLPKLTHAQIVRWARKHHERTGRWPTALSGRVVGTNGDTWSGVYSALRMGLRGLPRDGSIAKVLESVLGVRNKGNLPPISKAKVLAWADLHYRKTEDWPTAKSGVVHGSRSETWLGIDTALSRGRRGLSGGTTLAELLANHRGLKRHLRGRQLSVATVLDWAKAHCRRTGAFPNARSGPVHGKPGESWEALQMALVHGYRGLPKGTTVSKLLAPLKEKIAGPPVRDIASLSPRPKPKTLSEAEILAWADLHYRKTGDWPIRTSGLVYGSPSETWAKINGALIKGFRKLAGGSSLAKLLARHKGITRHVHGHQISAATVLIWAESHYRKTGKFPQSRSGPVHGQLGETWGALQMNLLKGHRGLPKGTTLSKLLAPLKERIARAGRP